MATLPGWMLLLGGAALVAMITLVPPWIECRKLGWQMQVMELQAQQLASQQVSYELFLNALHGDDPVVVERMAYYHLRLKPVGMASINDLNPNQNSGYNSYAGLDPLTASTALAPANKVWSTLPTIEDLLATPIYHPDVNCPPGVVPDTRMTRLVTGSYRHVLLGMGLMCLFFGLLPVSASATAVATTEPEDLAMDQHTQTYGLELEAGSATALTAAVVSVSAAGTTTTEQSDEADQLDATELDTSIEAAGLDEYEEDDDSDILVAELDSTELQTGSSLIDSQEEYEVDEDEEDAFLDAIEAELDEYDDDQEEDDQDDQETEFEEEV